MGNANGEAWLRISDARQEHVAEYKCEANNPAGKATTVANLVLKRKIRSDEIRKLGPIEPKLSVLDDTG